MKKNVKLNVVTTPEQDAMVEKFQCPGCVCGMDTKCGNYKPIVDYGMSCQGHVVGTMLFPVGHIALGLPKGFCRTGITLDSLKPERENGWRNYKSANYMDIRLWTKGTAPIWDKFNVPVWAHVQEGTLFVRTYSPRVNRTYTDVVEGGTLDMVPNAINVGEFISDMD